MDRREALGSFGAFLSFPFGNFHDPELKEAVNALQFNLTKYNTFCGEHIHSSLSLVEDFSERMSIFYLGKKREKYRDYLTVIWEIQYRNRYAHPYWKKSCPNHYLQWQKENPDNMDYCVSDVFVVERMSGHPKTVYVKKEVEILQPHDTLEWRSEDKEHGFWCWRHPKRAFWDGSEWKVEITGPAVCQPYHRASYYLNEKSSGLIDIA